MPIVKELQQYDLCYALVRKRGGSWILEDLFPVSIPRALFTTPPSELLPDTLKPANTVAELSPADRVFGWVKNDGAGAWRGKLRVGVATCEGGANSIESVGSTDNGLSLAILGQPKPQQARFYVAKDKDGKPIDKGTAKSRDAMYLQNQGLRGRKINPTQPQSLVGGYWNPGHAAPTQSVGKLSNGSQVYQEYRHMGGERNDQNRSVTEWVKQDSMFRFDIDVTNLTPFELGALFWLLSLNEGNSGKKRYLRLGGGKPLGFGTVSLEIECCDLRDGEAMAEDYTQLAERGPSGVRITSKNDAENKKVDGTKTAVDFFKAKLESSYGKGQVFDCIPFIRAFLNACEGGNLPVHYPRNSAHPTAGGENYKWFDANEKNGEGHALPGLENADRGLPILSP
jgi:CRISPR-associated protein (TIGR03986 family)